MQALRAADAAGNKEDAARLAQIAASFNAPAQAQVSQQTGPSFKSIMGQINKEIAEGAGGLIDF